MNSSWTKASLATIAIVVGIVLQTPGAVAKTDTAVDRSFADHGIFKAGGQSITAGYPGGRLLVLRGGGDGVSVERYLPNGRRDPSFGGGTGKVMVSRVPRWSWADASFWEAASVAVGPNGDIVVVGYLNEILGPEAEGGYHFHDTVLARLGPDGRLAWITEETTGESERESARQLPIFLSSCTVEATSLVEGKVLIGGVLGDPYGQEAHGFVARLNADGTPDRTFADGDSFAVIPPQPGGRGKSRFEGFSAVNALLPLPDGAIYAAGSLRSGLMLARLTRDGHLDRRFGSAGVVRDGKLSPKFREVTGVARDRAGKLIVAGTGRAFFLGLARFRPDGRRDGSFGRDGVVRTRVADYSWARGLAIQPDGRIVVAGAFTRRGSRAAGGDRTTLGLMRFRSNGRLDPTFFGDGIFGWRFGERWLNTSADWKPSIGPSGTILLAGGNAALRFRTRH